MDENGITADSRMRDGGVATLYFGKIAYSNPKRKSNLAQVEFGWRKLGGNDEPYFSVTGQIWNATKTDILTGGASVQKEIAKRLGKCPLLDRIVALGDKYHLRSRSNVPEDDRKAIDDLIEGVAVKHHIEMP